MYNFLSITLVPLKNQTDLTFNKARLKKVYRPNFMYYYKKNNKHLSYRIRYMKIHWPTYRYSHIKTQLI